MLNGHITDSISKQGIADVLILINGTQRAITDEHGDFHITHLCSGTYQIVTTHVSYRRNTKSIDLQESMHLDLSLSPIANQLSQVVIHGERSPEKANTGIRKELSGQQLDQTRGLSLAESLSKLPGVTMLQTGANITKPVFHGLHSNRVLTINNGVRQEGQQWGNEHAPEIDPFIADNLVVIKGVDELRYGSDAIGGVILVNPKPLAHQPGVNGEVNAGYFTNNQQYVVSAMAEQQPEALPALSYRLQGTYKHGNNVRTPDYRLNNTSLEEANFSITAGWKKAAYDIEAFYSHFQTKVGIFSGSHIGNLTDLLNAIASDRPDEVYTSGKAFAIERPYQQVAHDLIKLKSAIYTGNAGKLNLQLSAQYNDRKEYDIVRNNASSGPQMRLDVGTYAEDLSWDHTAFHGLRGTVGFSAMQQDNQYQGRYLIPQYTSSSVGAYWLESWHKNRWDVQGGVRFDSKAIHTTRYPYNREPISYNFNFSTLASSLNAAYHIGTKVKLNLATSLSSRAPHVNELLSDGIHHGTATYELGDMSLKPEKAWNTSLGFTFNNCANTLQADISLYYNHIDHFIFQQPLPDDPVLTIAGAFPKIVYQQTNASLKGIDASVGYRPTKNWDLLAKASILRAYNRDLDDWLIGMPSDRYSLAINYHFNDNTVLKNSYAGIEVPAVLRQTRVPDESIHGVQDYKAPPAGYLLCNATIGTQVHTGHQPIQVILSGNNLLNKRYREYLNSFRYFTDEMGRNISIRFKYTF